MKKLILCLILILTGQGLQAQTEKGTLSIGGNVSTGIWQLNAAERNNKQLTPTVGLFVRDNILIGVGVPLQSINTKFSKPELLGNLSSIRGTAVGLSLFVRRYMLNTRLKPFIHLDASYNTGTSRLAYTQGLPDKSVKGHYYSVSAGLGASYFVSNRLSIEATATLGIASLKFVIQDHKLDPSNRLLLLGLGANWYLPAKSKK